MRILLIGEYSRLHNSLKEGLLVLGHEVVLVSDGDGFKQFPADISFTATLSSNKIINLPRQAIYRLIKFDIAKAERGLRFYFLLNKLKSFDVVQLINEAPVKTIPAFEKFLLKKLIAGNKKTFLLSCGIDYISAKYMMDKRLKYSLMDPYFQNTSLKKQYDYVFEYLTKAHKNLHDAVINNVSGIIASDIDYVLPLQDHTKFLGLAPNPINTEKIEFQEPVIGDKIIIFLGINRGNYLQKGIAYFEDALKIVEKKYPEKLEIIITENIPYNDYIKLYNKANILLDQVFAYDQGYNALEAMAKGKVVFTGAEEEFTQYYNLTERVAVNALPDVDKLVQELCLLIENPDEIIAMGNRARLFIEKEHDYKLIAGKYIEMWGE